MKRKNLGGRPRKPGTVPILVRVDAPLLTLIDAWRARQLKTLPKIPSRPEALRRLAWRCL